MKNNSAKHIWVLAAGMAISSLATPCVTEAGIGKLWPFASKKHIKKQIDPLSGRVTELEEISRQHGTRIKEIDERTQAGIRTAMSQLETADAKAVAAGQKANEAGIAADKAYASVGDVERRLGSRLENVENYRLVRTMQVGFKPNQIEMDATAREQLDALAAEIKGSKGYVLEVQGFADPRGSRQANLELSRQRAGAVVRYLCEKHEVPLFRMRTLGMGAANAVKDENGRLSNQKSRRVEIHVLRNNATEVASN
ncbi:MAG: OmpA family protein [Acidobacteria bacterium]|nr:OmpA family protein [Acidobacteriota bacterium]MCI0724223.1 OmpA family protein [Acidobacteriota bacterium]